MRKVSVASLEAMPSPLHLVCARNVCDKTYAYFLSGKCLTKHPDFAKITDETVLRFNLKTVWQTGVIDTETQDFSNENLR